MDEVALRELANRIRAGDLSCREVVTAALQRLDRANALGAVAWRADDDVLARAAELDRAFAAAGPVGPLHGVPVSVKDWIDTTGFPCAAGRAAHAERRPNHDATVVARVRQAGAIVIAKSAIGPSSELNGTPRHPIDEDRTPGYSSAGEAVAVATGASTFGIGSDSGGSVRFPAHCCGLVGLRPTYGRVPVSGHFPRVGHLGDSRTVIGPLTRRVDDARMVLPLLAGPDGRDPVCAPVPLAGEPAVAGLRVAVHRQTLGPALRPDVAAALDAAADRLAAAGAIVTDDDVLDVERSLDITRRYWHRGALATGAVEALLADWDRSRVTAMRILARYDAVLSPAAPHPAPLLGVTGDEDWTFLLPISLWGWPAIVVPSGTSSEGLPLGVQIAAGPWQEPAALALAEVVEGSVALP